MNDPPPLGPRLPESFDGFRLELDPERHRADVILDRPPLNIITMAEREQLRTVFEALDADARIRVVVLRAAGTFPISPGTSPPRRAAASRSLPPAADIALASVSNWRWPAISASSPRPASIPCRSSVWHRSPDRVALRGWKK